MHTVKQLDSACLKNWFDKVCASNNPLLILTVEDELCAALHFVLPSLALVLIQLFIQ